LTFLEINKQEVLMIEVTGKQVRLHFGSTTNYLADQLRKQLIQCKTTASHSTRRAPVEITPKLYLYFHNLAKRTALLSFFAI